MSKFRKKPVVIVTKTALILMLTLLLCGCAIKRPIHALYCEKKSADGKHCERWAGHPPGTWETCSEVPTCQ